MNKKILAGVLASVMAVACAATVSAGQVTAGKTYDGGLAVDGSAGWNSAGSGETYVITEDAVTVVFNNEPFIRDNENWSNFVFETIATADAAGLTMRADAWAWTFGDNTDNVPEWTAATSWGVGDDFDSDVFHAAAPGKVELTAKKTDANTVTFSILFENGATESYTVTYPKGVPAGLEFQVGADGGKITLQSVSFASETAAPADDEKEDNTSTPADNEKEDNTSGENNTPAPGTGNTTGAGSDPDKNKQPVDTGIEGVAAVAGLAIVAAGAVVIAKKRK